MHTTDVGAVLCLVTSRVLSRHTSGCVDSLQGKRVIREDEICSKRQWSNSGICFRNPTKSKFRRSRTQGCAIVTRENSVAVTISHNCSRTNQEQNSLCENLSKANSWARAGVLELGLNGSPWLVESEKYLFMENKQTWVHWMSVMKFDFCFEHSKDSTNTLCKPCQRGRVDLNL